MFLPAGRPCRHHRSHRRAAASRPAWPSLRGKGIRNLDQDTGTIALQRIGAHSTPVIQVLEDLETLIDDLVSSVALDMCDEADTTGVMFVGWVMEDPAPGKIHLVFLDTTTHRFLHSCGTGHSNCGKSPRPNREKPADAGQPATLDPDEETVQTHWARVEYTAAGARSSRNFLRRRMAVPSMDLADGKQASVARASRSDQSFRQCSRQWHAAGRPAPSTGIGAAAGGGRS